MRTAVALTLVVLFALAATGAAGNNGKGSCNADNIGDFVSAQPHWKLGKHPDFEPNNDHLAACTTIVTEGQRGKLHFTVHDSGVDCVVMPHSTVQLEPTAKVLVQFGPGNSRCSTQSTPDRPFKAGQTIVRGEPLFSVAVGRRSRIAVHVARGFLQIGSKRRIVGPKQQATAVGSRVTSRKALPKKELDSLTRSAVGVVVPKPQFSRPEKTRRSKTLTRIFKRDRMIVGLTGGAGVGAQRFVRAYFAFLGEKWHLPVLVKVVARAKAGKLLEDGKIDVFVTRTRTPLPQTQTERLYGDLAGTIWSMATSPDAVFFSALDRFLQSALDTGDYGTRYGLAFRRPSPVNGKLQPVMPAYGKVEPVIFPKIGCTPGPSANYTTPYSLSLTLVSQPAGPFPGGKVIRTATVTNNGGRYLDCVAIHFHLFSGALAQGTTPSLKPEQAGECNQDTGVDKQQAGGLQYTCQVGPLPANTTAAVALTTTPAPTQSPTAPPTTCADTDATESGGVPEPNISDNGQCAQIVYRKASLIVGAADDTMKGATVKDATTRLKLLERAGLGAVVITEHWNPAKSAPGQKETAELQATAQAAKQRNITLVLAVFNGDPKDTPSDPAAQAKFAGYAAALLKAVPDIQYVIVGNEPNNGRFWAPQYDGAGNYLAASAYEALLAQTYDALHAVKRDPSDPRLIVIGGALAPRGVDKKPATGRSTRSPTTFITDLGTAYRNDGRSAPIMDGFALHPIPDRPDIPPTKAHPPPSKQLGISDYPRLVTLLGKAFVGTKQPVSDLPIYYTEYGVETFAQPGTGEYKGTQKTPATATEDQQGAFYRDAITLAACQPTVAGLFFLHAVDDQDFTGWQSGLYHLDGTPKTDLRAVGKAAADAGKQTLASCTGAPAAR